jgi:hypothetical protein
VTTARTLAVQTVLYRTPPGTVRASAEAVAASAALARREGLLGDWSYALGDGSGDGGVLSDDDLTEIRATIEPVGGALVHEVFDGNVGHGGGHNLLASRTDADLLLFLNPDARAAPETLVRLMEALEGDVGAADGRQLPMEHPKDFVAGRGDTGWVSGACLMTPRPVFDRAGRFDHETFFLYCDDVDYSWRVRLAGYRTVHIPGARVFHDKRLDARGDMEASDAERYYSAEAALLLAAKYSRPDVVQGLLGTYDRPDASDDQRRAAAEYRRRERSGRLATPLDPDHAVAAFVAGNYTEHRF